MMKFIKAYTRPEGGWSIRSKNTESISTMDTILFVKSVFIHNQRIFLHILTSFTVYLFELHHGTYSGGGIDSP